MKNLLILALSVVLFCGGCTAFWIVAGSVVAVSCADDVGHGLGQAFADLPKEFKEKAKLDTQAGRITLPEIAFTKERLQAVLLKLEKKFDANQWSHALAKRELAEKKLDERWDCKTAAGEAFSLHVDLQDKRDPTLQVETPQENEQLRADITRTIYYWLEEIIVKGWSET